MLAFKIGKCEKISQKHLKNDKNKWPLIIKGIMKKI